MESLRAEIKERLAPVVLVAGTPAAEAALAGPSGLSITDFLRPQARVAGMNVPIRVGEFGSRVTELRLRLVPWTAAFQPSPDVIDEHLRGVLAAAAQQHASLTPVADFERAARTEPPDALAPWYGSYRSEFTRLLRYGDHEALDHPVGALYFVPSDAPDAPAHAEALKGQLPPHPLAARELAVPPRDAGFVRFYVLLHDAAAPGADEAKAQANLAALQRAYGPPNVSLLRVNTRLAAMRAAAADATGAAAASVPQPLPPELFASHRRAGLPGGGAGEPDGRPAEPPGGLGAGLAPADLAAAGQLLRDFTQGCLLPKLEERVSRLNLSVTATRKGLRNRLTRLWKAGTGTAEGGGGGGAGSGGGAGPAAGSGGGGAAEAPPYVWHSVDAQMRQLGDLSLLLGFRDFAVATYRLAAQDYLAAPHSKWYAGVEEMIGLCAILGTSEAADPSKYLARAFEHYGRAPGRGGRMLATRAMAAAAAYQTATGRHASAVQSLMRAHFEEENARAALLLEQAAYAQARPRARFGFQLVLAGLRYHSARQKRLAAHCYRQVHSAYPGGAWRFISEHISDISCKQALELGDPAAALPHARALLEGAAHRPAAAQGHYLAQFLDVAARAAAARGGPPGVIEGLRVPAVSTDDVCVTAADQRCAGNAAAALVGGGAWAALEAAAAGAEMPSSNWLEGGKQARAAAAAASAAAFCLLPFACHPLLVRDGEEYTCVAAGEDVCVDVTFTNPLAIKLRLSAVRLVYEFTPDAAAGGGGVDGGIDSGGADSGGGGGEGAEGGGGGVQALPAQFALHPGEGLAERLALRPLSPGWLRVTGVAWALEGGPEGCVEFQVKGRHRKRPKGDRPSQRKHYPPHRRLLFRVLPGMPRLSVSLDALPARAFAGELLRVPLTITNVGRLPARALRLAVAAGAGVALAGPCGVGAGASAAELLRPGAPPEPLEPSGRRRKDGSETLLFSIGGGGGGGGCGGGGGGAAGAAAAAPPEAPELELAPGQSAAAALWLHAPLAGGLWKFLCAAVPPQMRFRAMRTAHALELAPLLSAAPGVAPAGSDLLQYLLRLDLECDREGAPVELSRVSVLTRGGDAGWRVAPVTGDERSGGGGGGGGGGGEDAGAARALAPGVRLAPGESSCQFLRLLSPAARGAAAAAAAQGQGRPPQQQGREQQPAAPLLYFHRAADLAQDAARGRACGAQRAAGGAGSRGGSSPAVAALADGGGGAAAECGGGGGEQQQQQQPVEGEAAAAAEPPVDVLLEWSAPAAPPGAAPGAAAPPGAAAGGGGRRVGLLSLYDICAAQRLNPVRMQLRGPAAPVPHDFRGASLCVVPLTLQMRNCGAAAAALTVRAASAWEGYGTQHAWLAAPPRGGRGGGGGGGGGGGAPPPSPPAVVGGAGFGPPPPGPPGGRPHTPPAPSPGHSPRGEMPGGGAAAALQAGLPPSAEHVWCGRTVAPVPGLAPGAAAEVPLAVAVFRPGTYVLDDYVVDWECPATVLTPGGGGGRLLRGSKLGEPFVLRVEAAGGGARPPAPVAAAAAPLDSLL
ncbi:MAG: ER-golgi trafficking TRAPP I complex 85 kDa subunit-domain-containing protein [Monoraphidium minutum]|nr:MAG: ER-golgi trafficking TRAPP I complex 85 kDa subunit-domain-containing protein [Monoraphidium minutum]